jgi:hypothetical protein
MQRWLLLLFCVVLAAAVGTASSGRAPPTAGPLAKAIAGPVAQLHSDSLPVEDPFPIRRIRTTEAQLPEVLKQFDAGPLVRLPRGEFEARVREAGRAMADARNLPRIVDTRFQASLVGGDLVGTAELVIVNASTTSHFLPLDPLKLALGQATWGDGREAVLGVPTGATAAGVWVDRPGRQSLKFGWSLAGITEPGEQQFELRVPTASTAVLELELPSGQVPTVAATEVLLTGPFPIAGDPPRSLWRLRFGGRPRLDFAVRPAGNPGLTAAANLKATYDISLGQLLCGFDYDLRPAKGTVGVWEFSVDPGLRVTDVVVNNRAGWVIEPPSAPGMPRVLRVTLRQPGAGGKVLISTVAPFPDSTRPADAPLPIVRPIGANLGEETIELHFAPGLKLGYWHPGDYRLTDSQTLADQTRVLTLAGTLAPPGVDRLFRRPPEVRTTAVEAEFTTTEQIAWRFDADRVSARVRVGLQVRRGPLFQFTLHPPSGYSLARVSSTPDELVSYTATSGTGVTVEFAHPLGSGQSAELAFDFSGPALSSGTHRLPFPAFIPVGATERVGVLGILPGAAWATESHPGTGTTAAGWLDVALPLAPPGSASAFRYLGGDPDGWMNLTIAKPEFTVDACARSVPEGGKIATTTLAIHVKSGALSSVEIAESTDTFANRTWRVIGSGNAVAAAVPLPVSDLVKQRLWLVRFARPVTDDVVLETVGNAADRVVVSGASQYRVVLAPDENPPLSQKLSQPWGFSGLYLVTAVRGESEVVAVFGGTVSAAGDTVLPITLPQTAEVRAVNVGGKWLDQGSWRATTTDAGVCLKIPISAAAPIRFEVRYRLPMEAGTLARQIASPEPKLAGESVECVRWWGFASGVLPGWPVRAWDRETAADLPELLGDPIAGAGVIFRSPVEEVRFASTRSAVATGIVIAALFFALAWAAGRRRHPFCGLVLLAGLLAVGMAVLLGPPWWQRAAMVPLVIGLAAAAGTVLVRGHWSRVPAATAAAVLICTFTHSDITAQPIAPATVAILPADSDAREVVVAPKAVLDRLGLRPSSPSTIVTSAEYAATTDDTTAQVTAKFVVHSLDAAETIATLPISEARLERVTVNGTAAFPAAPRPGVYTVPLPGKGRHEIEVRFAVPVTGIGTEREFRFGVPDGPNAKVTADLPGSAKQPQVVGRVGRQTIASGTRLRLETEVGGVRGVQVRWRDGAGNAAAVVKVREGCVWDVSESGAELTACYLVRVEQGTVSSLRFDLPAELDPLGVVVRPLEAGGIAALRDWTLAPEQNRLRQMRLELQGPTAGRVLVVLTLNSRKAGTRQPVLRFPKVILPGGATAEPEAAYGLRAKSVTIEELALGGVIDFSPDALTRDFATVSDLHLEPNTPVRVFRPTPGGVPELRPTLRVAIDRPSVTLDTAWHIGTHRAEAAGTVHWAAKDAVTLLEFAFPANLSEVRGTDVVSWSQASGHVQVWLKKPTKEGELAWSATINSPPIPFDAATPRVSEGRLVTNTLQVRPLEGFSLTVEREQGWVHAGRTGDTFTYRTSNSLSPPVRVALSPLLSTARADEFGWFSPSPKPSRRVTPPPLVPPAILPAALPPANVSVGSPLESGSRRVSLLSGAGVWCIAIVVLALMLARFSRSTWPEQLGLIGGLFGAAVTGGWWVGFAAWAAARIVWLGETVVGLRPPAKGI